MAKRKGDRIVAHGDAAVKLLAAMAYPERNGWQPIETAPRDRPVLVWNGYWGVYSSRYWEEFNDDGTLNWAGFPHGHCDVGFGKWYPVASYWMPLPAPPNESNGEPT